MKKAKAVVIVIVVVVAIILAFAAWAFFWPSQSADLQKANIVRRNYEQSVADINSIVARDTANNDVTESCRPIIKTHNKKTAKAVVLIHGVSGCPSDMAALADWFFEAGYNIYVPRTPHHGLRDRNEHSNVRASELASFGSESISLASGLGDEIGVIGHSGGGNLATWLTQYSDGVVSRVLLLAPFYEPDASQAPKWQIPFLRNLHGNHLIPDQRYEELSYRALANYVILRQNYRSDLKAKELKHIGVVVASEDHLIDGDLARNIPEKIAQASGASFTYEVTPKTFGVDHLMLDPANSQAVAKNKQVLFSLYQRVYEK